MIPGSGRGLVWSFGVRGFGVGVAVAFLPITSSRLAGTIPGLGFFQLGPVKQV
jgi:hypothetical protein